MNLVVDIGIKRLIKPWVDRVTFINEGSVHYIADKGIWSTSDRKVLGGTTYTEFKKEEKDWAPIENFEKYAEELKDEYKSRKYNV